MYGLAHSLQLFCLMYIIQKSFNRFSASLHLKVNELVASHEPASNAMINAEEKTEQEISQLTKEYTEQIKKEDEETTGKTMDSIRTEKQSINVKELIQL